MKGLNTLNILKEADSIHCT